MLMNTGDEIVESKNGLVSTIGIAANGKISYALEGSIFAAGSTMNWLRNNMGIISSVSESAQLAASISDNEGCYFVPAFAGLGAPWWDPHARGIVCGLTGASSRATIVRAACESMAYQSYDVLRAMEQDVGLSIERLSVDGGASRNEFIMQFQADLLDIPVLQCETVETTAIGAAYLAGLAVGYWEDLEELEQNAQIVRTFLPHMSAERREQNLAGWCDAVRRSLSTAQ
jgi:glycerol kinase